MYRKTKKKHFMMYNYITLIPINVDKLQSMGVDLRFKEFSPCPFHVQEDTDHKIPWEDHETYSNEYQDEGLSSIDNYHTFFLPKKRVGRLKQLVCPLSLLNKPNNSQIYVFKTCLALLTHLQKL